MPPRLRVPALLCLFWLLRLPFDDVLQFPQRLSVLPNLEADAAAYDAFARAFADSWQLSALPSKHPPGWMLMLAGVYAVVGHSFVAGKLLSWVALLLTVGLCAWLGKRVYGSTAAVIAALLCASSPGLRAYVGTLQYEVVTAALCILFLVLSVRVSEAKTQKEGVIRAIAAGFAGGALVLTRETFVLVVPLAAWWIWQRLMEDSHLEPPAGLDAAPSPSIQRDSRLGRRREALVAVALVVVVAAAPAIIWSIAQSVHYGRLILIAEKGPKEFQLGNHALANGTYNEPLVGMAERAGLAYIQGEPLRAFELSGRKFLYFFGLLRDGWSPPQPAAVWIWRASTGAIPLNVIEPVVRGGWLLVAVAFALFQLGRDGLARWWLLPATVGAILFVHVLTLGSYRFAVPILPVLYVLASGPLARLIGSVAQRARSPLVAMPALVIVGIVIAAQFRAWPLRVVYDGADLDGLSAMNAIDQMTGRPVRVADAKRGVRPVVLLPDTYLPRGGVTVTVAIRRLSDAEAAAEPSAGLDTPVARVVLLHLDGLPACATEIAENHLATDRFTDIAVPCRLERDGPATLAVFSLGKIDLVIDRVRLAWHF